MPGARGPDPDPDGQMGLSGAGRAEQDHVLGFLQEDPGAQMRDEVPVRGRLMVEVELFQQLVSGEPRGPDPQGGPGGLTFGDLAGEDSGEVFLV